MLELAARFVPAADEVHRLQSGSDPECRLFQKIAEQGHYAGRTQPTNTRQGIYAAAPSGVMLASVNSNDPRRMARMLREALAKWETLPREERLLAELPRAEEIVRRERFYPADGLVLAVHSRDLPRERTVSGWRADAWNQDFAWFRKEEARQFLPAELAAGQRREVPEALVRRLSRAHLVDNVRGQTPAYQDRHIEKARLAAEVTGIGSGRVRLRLEGETRAVAEGQWAVRGFADMNSPSAQTRGYDARLLGFATYDVQTERFVAFELVAVGMRWGGTQYNGRSDDLEPAPLGFAFTLTGDSPAERVAPAHLGAYGWR